MLKHHINNKEKEDNNKKKDKEINYLTTFVVLCNKACVWTHAYITTTVDMEKHNSKQRIFIF